MLLPLRVAAIRTFIHCGCWRSLAEGPLDRNLAAGSQPDELPVRTATGESVAGELSVSGPFRSLFLRSAELTSAVVRATENLVMDYSLVDVAGEKLIADSRDDAVDDPRVAASLLTTPTS